MRSRHGQARRLASTVGLDRQAWLAIRQRGIGSSDAAAAVGLSPYKSPLTLWLEKTGRQLPEDVSGKEAVVWGTVLEPVLARVYAERTGRRVRRVNAVLQHPGHAFMLANLDREVVGEAAGPGVLEIKTAGWHSAPQWEDGIPVAYQCQVLHQLAVTGHAWADVAVLVGGQDFRIWRVERDEAKIADLIEREAAFWQAVQTGQQPMPDGTDDAGRALLGLFPQDNGDTLDLSESAACNALFGDLLAIRQRKEEAEAIEARLRQQLQAALGSATSAVFQGGGKISWKKSKDRLAPDLERLSLDHPGLLQQYSKPVAGSRRFVVQAGRGRS
ncbi:YqaJ viral recombinase family protein [Laribacter hongkongensis]|uniref:YqaJ viral recombinase family nuclease n=1 Tax=Laribacter hongkongensis TaxID=168471 RepID=UPI001EFD826E|nr:YqaJ viral recombinase family protein [Laribacter hongkongensis]MCG9056728.1 YqaJ viral recombinase family protein [Laribacter hongkongensis]